MKLRGMSMLLSVATMASGLILLPASLAQTWPHVGVRADRVVDPSRATYFVSVEGDDGRDGRSAATIAASSPTTRHTERILTRMGHRAFFTASS